MVAGANVNLVGVDFRIHLGSNGAGLGDFLGHQPFPFQHIEKVGVAAEVQLIGVLNGSAPVCEQAGQNPVQDGGPHLGFDVVADNRHAPFLEAVAPVGFPGDKDRDAVDHSAAGVKDLLGVPLGRHFAAHRQVVDDHIHLPLFEDAGNVGGGMVGLFDQMGNIAADAVVGHSPFHRHAQAGDIGELDGIVGRGENGRGQVLAYLVFVDVKGGHHLDVLDAVVADLVVHHPGNLPGGGDFHILVDSLHQGGGAVAHADDGYLYLAQVVPPLSGPSCPGLWQQAVALYQFKRAGARWGATLVANPLCPIIPGRNRFPPRRRQLKGIIPRRANPLAGPAGRQL